jgi:hypothetical protein
MSERVALVPFLKEMRRQGMSCGANRAIGENNRTGRYAGENELVALKRAPLELRTISDGTISVFAAPMVFEAGLLIASSAAIAELVAIEMPADINKDRDRATALMHASSQ